MNNVLYRKLALQPRLLVELSLSPVASGFAAFFKCFLLFARTALTWTYERALKSPIGARNERGPAQWVAHT